MPTVSQKMDGFPGGAFRAKYPIAYALRDRDANDILQKIKDIRTLYLSLCP